MNFSKFQILLIISLLSLSVSKIEDEIVHSLPGYSYRGRLYSGYLSVSTVKQFHYMFNLAHDDYENKPLVLWLNGGPGCSSLDGWSSENGPMVLDEKGNFVTNEYSWNRAANMLYIESPGNVGFSYIDSKLDYELEINDDIAAEDNFKALMEFYTKFPSFKGKDFYISGESYAGIYIPMLAYKIIQYNQNADARAKINLKGILVGNGVADWNYDTDKAMTNFAFTHHLTSYEHRLKYNKYCVLEYDKTECDKLLEQMEGWLKNVNTYDYLQQCETPKTEFGDEDYFSSYYLRAPWAFPNLKQKQQALKEKLEKMKQNNNNEKLNNILDETDSEKKLQLDPPCINTKPMTTYFNKQEVQDALHIPKKITWEICSSSVNQLYQIQEKGSIWAYPTIIKSGIRVLIYNGDTDMAVPFNGNQAWIKNLKLERIQPWRQWRAFNDMNNVAGYYVKYKGLTFCTVKGTGHMVPQWKPKEAYYMFSKFLNDEDF